MLYLFVIIIIILALCFSYLGLCYFLSGTILHLDRQPVPKNPKDYGMDFENIEFRTSDKVNIKGWLIPGSSNKLIIMTHVGGLTKYGSTTQYKSLTKLYNKEIEFLKAAKHLHNEGYWVLMFDFRNHGESDPSPNKGIATFGLEEYKDVVGTMEFVKKRPDLKDKAVGFVSYCFGANSTIVAMSKKPEIFKDIKCLVAIQPISMEVFFRTYLKKRLSPFSAKLIVPMVKKFIVWRGSYPLAKLSPADFTKDIRVPTLYVQAKNDPWTELSDVQGFYKNTPSPKELFWIENTSHRFESYQYFGEKPQKMLEWLKKWM